MAEQFCPVGNDVVLCYETFGDPSDPPALLVMGLAMQMIAWPDDFCAQLAGRGLYVVRFDNRDAGRSTHIDAPPPTPGQILRRSPRGARYTLADMAGDAAGLLRELDLAPAHVIGVSMGGMIGQTLAARHPVSVRSLVSIMSSTGSRLSGQPSPRLYPFFLRPPRGGRDEYIARVLAVFSAIGSPGFARDFEDIRDMAGRSYDREHDPAGPARQLAAIFAAGNRVPELRRIDVPTVVIHGTADRLIAPSGGRATARAIPGARLVLIDGMGHDLPRGVWPRIFDQITENVASAEGAHQLA